MDLPVWALPPVADGDAPSAVKNGLREITQIEVEAVGRWFASLARKRRLNLPVSHCSDGHGVGAEEDDSGGEQDDNANGDNDKDELVNIAGEWKDQDHYALLGLENLRWRATQDDIKKAHRKAVLKHHPDKKGDLPAAEAKAADEYFARITKAYELLSSKKQRRMYDSVDDVDDSVPPAAKSAKQFFSKFPEAFERNARWIEQQPVPKLGDESTPIEEVQAFYNFWYSATSWREFGYDDEEDPEEAESREERRWIERQLRASRKKRKKAEVARLLRLVDNAYSSDPRVRKAEEEAKKKKQEMKRAKAEARMKAEMESKRREEEEAEAKRKAAEQEKLKGKKAIEAGKKARRALTKACKKAGIYDPENPALSEEAAGKPVLSLLDMDALKAMSTEEIVELAADKDKDDFAERVFETLEELREAKNREAHKNREWTPEEQASLEAAIKQVPASDPDRWRNVAKLVPGRSKKECVNRIKEIRDQLKKKAEDTNGKPDVWTPEEELMVNKAASKVFPPGTQGNRWAKIGEYVQTHAHTEWIRSEKEVVKKVNELKNVNEALSKHKRNADDFKKFQENQSGHADIPEMDDPSKRN